MSLADQSQQFLDPTGVRVTVHQARDLRAKGKNGTNDAYAIIQVSKDKFSTSVDERTVAPVWKEEASFPLPLFHPGDAEERCTLRVIVMHRAQVGLDKFLGQAVVNLLHLQDEEKLRKKTDWFRLVDKSGKDDKARGEVLLDIQFMRNNMSASMFDLSMQDKPRSRLSKLKDKVRVKKKDGFSDSASAIVPPVSQVGSDSEGEADAQSLNQFPTKKKSKLKKLFAPKSNLHKNISQSMSTLGTLPSKDSSLSGSRSSGLNVDSPEVKKKFKFLGHKRTGSNDSKASQGPFSLLGRHKQSASDLNSLCINGSHVYTEEAEPKTGSTLSLNSSGQGSAEDVRAHASDFSADSAKGLSVPTYRPAPAAEDREGGAAVLEQRRRWEEEEEAEEKEEERRQAEERRRAEGRRLAEEEEEEEGRRRAEAKRLQEAEEQQRRYREEQERRQRLLEEEEARRKKKIMDEEERQRGEERRRLQAMEKERNEEEHQRREEAQKAEEKKRQEEASMSERLSTLFGITRKKEEKKEEEAQPEKENPVPAPRRVSHPLEVHGAHQSTNPFEDIPLSPETQNPFEEPPAGPQKPIRSPQTLSAAVFLNRTAKVSTVKPRLRESLTSEHCSSTLNTSESTVSSVPSDSPDLFANLSASNPQHWIPPTSGSSSSSSMPEKRRAPVLPTCTTQGAPAEVTSQMERMTPRGGAASGGLVRAIENPAYVESDGTAQGKRPSLPLPDYETLFPKKRHGVQGQTRWDHLVAEVQQRKRDKPDTFLGQEMSVDGPEEQQPSREPSPPSLTKRSGSDRQRPADRFPQSQVHEAKPISSKRTPPPPKPVAAPLPRPTVDNPQKQSQSVAQVHPAVQKPNASALPGFAGTQTPSREVLSGRDGVRKEVSAFAIDESFPQSQVHEAKPISSKRTPPPPKPVAAPLPRPTVDNHKKQSQSVAQVHQAVQKPNASALPGFVGTQTPNREVLSGRDGVRKEVSAFAIDESPQPSVVANTTSQTGEDVNTEQTTKETPTAKPRLKVVNRDGGTRADATATDSIKCNDLLSNEMDKKIKEDEIATFDSQAKLEQNQAADDLFKVQKELKPEDRGMTTDDFDQLFTAETDPFGSFYSGETQQQFDKDTDSNQHIPSLQNLHSQKGKQTPTSLAPSNSVNVKGKQELAFPEAATTTAAVDSVPSKEAMTTAPPASHGLEWTENPFGADPFGHDPFGKDPFAGDSPTFSEPHRLSTDESGVHAEGPPGGRNLLRAWVSPTEGQPVSAQNSSVGGPASSLRRPHPVKPMSSTENQYPTSTPAVKEIKILDTKAAQIKAEDPVESGGAYTQLTQEELITLVVKQQVELTKRKAKITELEEYIDNLLVRVIEEKPSILLGISSSKPA